MPHTKIRIAKRIALAAAALTLSSSLSLGAPPASPAPPGGSSGASPPRGAAASATTTPPAASAACERGATSSLAIIGCKLAASLGSRGAGALVVAAPLESDRTPRRAAALTHAVAALLAGGLSGHARAAEHPVGLARARSLAARRPALIYLTLSISGGRLSAVADLYLRPKGFWSRLGRAQAAPLTRAFAERRLDAEIAGYLQPIPLVVSSKDFAPAAGLATQAMACGDADGDGSLELAIVDRHRARLTRLRGGRLAHHARLDWREHVPVAPAPLRDPIAMAFFTEATALELGISDRSFGLRVDGNLQPLEQLSPPVPWHGVGCLEPRVTGLGARRSCGANAGQAPSPPEGTLLDAAASLYLRDGRGRARWVVAWREAGRSEITLRDGAGRSATIAGAGAQLGLADLDLDGSPEVLSSRATLTPEQDALRVHTWPGEGPPKLRMELPFPEGIRAVAPCPPDGQALAPFAVATSAGVWVLR